jgi:hypothetical protein
MRIIANFVIFIFAILFVIYYAAVYVDPWFFKPTFNLFASICAVVLLILVSPIIAKLRQLAIYLIITLLVLFGALFLLDVGARFFTPSWPAYALHGVQPKEGANAWGRIVKYYPDALGFNTWGQRDVNHNISPSEKKRILFIGDSFLEESSITPISSLVQKQIGDNFETINLGVSATDPMDYYWRFRNVGQKLLPTKIIIFFYEGNDYLNYRTTNTIDKISTAAPYPSLLGLITPYFNHYLSGAKNPSSHAWLGGRNLAEAEERMLQSIKQASYDDFKKMLHQISGYHEQMQVQLEQNDFKQIFNVAKVPDLNLFRTYMLSFGVEKIISNKEKVDDVHPSVFNSTLFCLLKLGYLAKEKGIDVSFVGIPIGFSVDPRLNKTYEVFGNMREYFSPVRQSTVRLADRLRNLGYQYLDLYEFLNEKTGTYLNFDGHWSTLGNQIAANAVSNHILTSEHLKPPVALDKSYNSMRVSDLRNIQNALSKYHRQYGSYPKSNGYQGKVSCWGASKTVWIDNLVPNFIEKLPVDPRNDQNCYNQYLYQSDGVGYKLIAHHPEDLAEVVLSNPQFFDPARPFWAYGVWSSGMEMN